MVSYKRDHPSVNAGVHSTRPYNTFVRSNTMQISGTPLSQATSPAVTTVAQPEAARSVAREGLKYALVVWLVVRVVLSAWGALIMVVAPEESHAHVRRDYPDAVLPNHDLYGYTIGLWNIYDVRHY